MIKASRPPQELSSRTRHLRGTSTCRLTKRLNGTEDQSSHRETGGGALQFLWLPLIRVNPQTLSSRGVFVFLVLVEILGERTSPSWTRAPQRCLGRGASTAAPQGSLAAGPGPLGGISAPLCSAPWCLELLIISLFPRKPNCSLK